ncbi:MAG TPA: hypothetical protein VF525_20450 [Pyrinomonadaceae bacterium]|jgi:hypothetical protein
MITIFLIFFFFVFAFIIWSVIKNSDSINTRGRSRSYDTDDTPMLNTSGNDFLSISSQTGMSSTDYSISSPSSDVGSNWSTNETSSYTPDTSDSSSSNYSSNDFSGSDSSSSYSGASDSGGSDVGSSGGGGDFGGGGSGGSWD